jgi:hypothetical protein
MNSPFPGMDPYLEQRWSDVHTKLISFIGEALQETLPHDLRARSEESILLEEESGTEKNYRADVAIVSVGQKHSLPPLAGSVAVAEPLIVEFESASPLFHRFVQIIDVTSGNKVVSVIEVLSPWNKKPGRLNRHYRRKLEDYAAAKVSIIEIDLLRSSRARLRVTEAEVPHDRSSLYLACVQRGWSERDAWEVYSIPLRQSIPAIPVPLRQSDPDAVLQLQPMIQRVYRASGHDDINYAKPLDPPLSELDEAWADQLLKAAGRRS